jgi:hypothetical protein
MRSRRHCNDIDPNSSDLGSFIVLFYFCRSFFGRWTRKIKRKRGGERCLIWFSCACGVGVVELLAPRGWFGLKALTTGRNERRDTPDACHGLPLTTSAGNVLASLSILRRHGANQGEHLFRRQCGEPHRGDAGQLQKDAGARSAGILSLQNRCGRAHGNCRRRMCSDARREHERLQVCRRNALRCSRQQRLHDRGEQWPL